MSHFSTVVLVSKHTKNIEAKVAKLLAPYDENKKVKPYISETAQQVKARREEVKKLLEDPANTVLAYLKEYREGKLEKMTLAEFARSWFGQDVDEEGNLLSIYNPKSRWDWYELGGRWKDKINGNICPVSKLPKDFSCFAIVTPDGEWHEEGKMGWWAIVINEKDKAGWELEQALIFENYKECLAVIVDYHI